MSGPHVRDHSPDTRFAWEARDLATVYPAIVAAARLYYRGNPLLRAKMEMSAVGVRDEARIARINAADAEGFWDLVRENRDDLKWCGSAPFYTFLKAVPKARGELLRYEQWNIDEHSVVSFAGMAFSKEGGLV